MVDKRGRHRRIPPNETCQRAGLLKYAEGDKLRKGRQYMNREPRRIPPKLLANAPKHITREVAALHKAAKDVLRRGGRGKIPLSLSQPHSKTFGR